MPCLRGLILLAAFCTATAANGQYVQPTSFATASLQAINLSYPSNGRPAHIDISIYSKPLVLFVFLSPECPLSQQYSIQLNQLATDYKQQLIVCGIFPGRSYDRKTINAFLTKYKILFPTFIDPEKKLTGYLDATVTPEVVLLSSDTSTLHLQYRGAIDDRVKALGVKKLKASSNFVRDAIDQWLQQKDIVIKRTDPVGCFINDY